MMERWPRPAVGASPSRWLGATFTVSSPFLAILTILALLTILAILALLAVPLTSITRIGNFPILSTENPDIQRSAWRQS